MSFHLKSTLIDQYDLLLIWLYIHDMFFCVYIYFQITEKNRYSRLLLMYWGILEYLQFKMIRQVTSSIILYIKFYKEFGYSHRVNKIRWTYAAKRDFCVKRYVQNDCTILIIIFFLLYCSPNYNFIIYNFINTIINLTCKIKLFIISIN